MGAGNQRWWRDPAELAVKQREWVTYETMRLLQAITRGPRSPTRHTHAWVDGMRALVATTTGIGETGIQPTTSTSGIVIATASRATRLERATTEDVRFSDAMSHVCFGHPPTIQMPPVFDHPRDRSRQKRGRA